MPGEVETTGPFRCRAHRIQDVTVLTLASRNHLRWLARRNLSRSTIATRRTVLEAIEDHTGDPLAATLPELETVLDSRRFASSTRNVWISHMRSFYRWAVDDELLAVDPARRLTRAEVPENLPRPIPEPALAHAIAAADPEMRRMLILGAYAGLRCSEIARLRGDHLEGETIRVERSKGGRSRLVPMHPRVVELFDQEPPGLLWHHTPNAVCVRIGKHLRACGYDYTAHQLRHRFATNVYLATGDINVVRQLLGHASVATTQVYTRVTVEHVRAAVALIA